MPIKPHGNKGRVSCNPRTAGSAAAFAGVIGLPDPGIYIRGEGSMRAFTREVAQGFNHFINAAPERRSHLRDTPEFRGDFRFSR